MVDVSMIEFTVSREVADVVADWFWANGASAVVEAEAPDSLFPDVVSLTADLPGDLVAELLADRVGDPALEYVLAARVVGDAADDHRAAQRWKEFMGPVAAGRFVIVPEWDGASAGPASASGNGDPVAADGDGSPPIVIRMDPGDAFGAGTHVTTRLCLEAAGGVVRGGETVLDLGCGTGVLGVAAAMIGARSVRATDIDPEAVRVTRRVAALNGVGDRVEAVLVDAGDPDPVEAPGIEGCFDIVFANVLIGVIVAYGESLARAVAPGGALVISGILVDQGDRALGALGLTDHIPTDHGHDDGPTDHGHDDDSGAGGAGDERSQLVVEQRIERDGWLLLVLRADGRTRR